MNLCCIIKELKIKGIIVVIISKISKIISGIILFDFDLIENSQIKKFFTIQILQKYIYNNIIL